MADIGKVISSVVTGAATGSAAGPVGMAGGAAVALALQLAPDIGKWITGNDDSQVVAAVHAVTGPNPPADVASLDAASRVKLTLDLAQIAADREAAHDSARNDELVARLGDVAGARQATLALAQAGSKISWGAPVVSVVVLLTFGVLSGVLVFHAIPTGSDAVLQILLGNLGVMAASVVAYWVGSSAGSARKTELLSRSIPSHLMPNPAALVPAKDAARDSGKVSAGLRPDSPASRPQQAQPRPEPIEPVIIPQAPPPQVADRKAFFDAVREPVFGGRMVQSQVDGCQRVLEYWDDFPGATDRRWLAYILATAFWETGRTMQPVEEVGRGAGHAYGKGGWYGRGLVQITLEDNYRRMSPIAGVDLVAHPEAALTWPVALAVMFHGMIAGMFTGKKLADYFNASVDDPIGCRAVVNGTDRATEIAALHVSFLRGLDAEFHA